MTARRMALGSLGVCEGCLSTILDCNTFLQRKIGQYLKVRGTKPQIVNQQRVVHRFQCDLCEAGYVVYTRGHLHTRVDGHKQKASSVYKHCHEQYGEVPKDLLRHFSGLKKCRNKFD